MIIAIVFMQVPYYYLLERLQKMFKTKQPEKYYGKAYKHDSKDLFKLLHLLSVQTRVDF